MKTTKGDIFTAVEFLDKQGDETYISTKLEILPEYKFIQGSCCLYPPKDDGDRISFYEVVSPGWTNIPDICG